jgi:hypothetical protein
MATVNSADISLRPARDGDEPFLKRVHDAARHWEFASLLQTGETELYHQVMAQQYDLQHRFYFANDDTAHYGIIQWTWQPIGRLYVDCRATRCASSKSRCCQNIAGAASAASS